MRRAGAVAAVLVSLLVVGLIRSAPAPWADGEYLVRADVAGTTSTAATDEYSVTLESLDTSEVLLVDVNGELGRLTADETFVLARLSVTPRGRSLRPRLELRTADGYAYRNIDIHGIAPSSVVHVGQTATASYFFEVPADKVEGAWVAVMAPPMDGVQAITPTLRFDVANPQRHDEFLVPPAQVRAR